MATNKVNGQLQVTQTTTFDAGCSIGGGHYMKKVFGVAHSQDVPTVTAQEVATFNVTITGILVADKNVTMVETPAGYDSRLIASGNVTADDTVTVRVHNVDNNTDLNPAVATFNIAVFEFST